MIEAWQLGASRSDDIDKIKTHWACGSKGIDGSESVDGTYCNCSAMEQNIWKTSEVD
jgi:hypothetical protein